MGEHGRGTRVTIRRRLASGTIQTRIRVVVTMADGRRVSRTARTDREADRIQRELVEARERGLDPSRQTLADFLRSWIAGQREAKHRRIRERTLIGYDRLVEQRIIPELGAITLSQLTKRRIQSWVNQQSGSGQTVRNAHAVLRKALASATGDLIPANPAIGVELPVRRGFAGAPLTVDESRRLLAATAGDRLEALWRLALVTGLREGELLGLPRDALQGSTLTVKSQLQRIGGRWVLGPTKAARSLEQIEVGSKTAAVVRSHLARMAAERKPDWPYFGLMFVTESGEPYQASRILDEFHRACDRARIPRRRFHDLRHTSNRLLKDLGVDREIRKARFGHSTDEMTAGYGGASLVADKAAAELLEEAFGA